MYKSLSVVKRTNSFLAQEDFNLVCDRAGLLSIRQMIFFLGMVIGCLCTGQLSDKFGRKKTMLVSMFTSTRALCMSLGYFSYNYAERLALMSDLLLAL